MTDSKKPTECPQPISLKNPVIAGLFAWFFPGLGHWYQGRYPKAILFFCCIFPLFIFGCYCGSSREFGIARNVYYSWRPGDMPGDMRLFFIPQACLGIAAVPAMMQAMTVGDGRPVFGRFMVAPLRDPSDSTGIAPTLDEMMEKYGNGFEIGTIFTVIAGLMNLLVIFDAVAGPVVYEEEEEKNNEEDEEKSSSDKESGTA